MASSALRTGASRLAYRAIAAAAARPAASTYGRTGLPLQWHSKFTSASSKRPQIAAAALRPVHSAILRRTKIDHAAEEHHRQEKLRVTPETVSATSTVRPTLGEVGGAPAPNTEKGEPDTMAGLKSDFQTIKSTFDLSEVPRQAYYLGLGGVLPYLATSLSTLFCANEINYAETAGTGHILTAQTAETILTMLEPIQVGYGAVILSFLGAIHWGLEWAGYGGSQGMRRYAIGVLAPAVAWPTLLLSVEGALISQFGAFMLLYYADVRATNKGWTPPWYGIYRFVLTFIVGSSLVLSLIGRGEVSNRIGKHPGAVEDWEPLRQHEGETEEQQQEQLKPQHMPHGEVEEKHKEGLVVDK